MSYQNVIIPLENDFLDKFSVKNKSENWKITTQWG